MGNSPTIFLDTKDGRDPQGTGTIRAIELRCEPLYFNHVCELIGGEESQPLELAVAVRKVGSRLCNRFGHVLWAFCERAEGITEDNIVASREHLGGGCRISFDKIEQCGVVALDSLFQSFQLSGSLRFIPDASHVRSQPYAYAAAVTEREDAWAQLHAATPPGWSVGRPSYHNERRAR